MLVKEEIIVSTQNQKIKDVVLLQGKAREREKRQLFTVEGLREINACIAGGYKIASLFCCPSLCAEGVLIPLLAMLKSSGAQVNYVAEKVYEKIAYRSSTEGVVAVVKTKAATLADIEKQITDKSTAACHAPLILVAERVEKPGNLGAILRTADACAADAVLFCDCATDLYNPNLIRASLGGIFTQNVVQCTSGEAIKWLKQNNITIFTAQLQDSIPYYSANMRQACAIVLGSEAEGLTRQWREASDQKIMIPMLGHLDSLNVSVSAAVLCYEALRQRKEPAPPQKQCE